MVHIVKVAFYLHCVAQNNRAFLMDKDAVSSNYV